MTRLPSVALLRGEALNPYEMQVYGALTDHFDLLAVGRRRPLHEVDRVPLPTVLLHSIGEVHALSAVHRRLSRRWRIPGDPDRLFGLAGAVGRRDVLHAAETVLPVSEQAAELAVERGSKLVLTCWETIPFRYDDDPVLAARKVKVKRATSIYLAVTDRARTALLAEGIPSDLIRVVPASIDCTRFRPLPRQSSVRRGWGVPAGARVALYVGRLIQEKGVVELVRAFAGVDDCAAHLVLVGSGNQGERLQIAARTLGVSDRVHVAAGVSHGALPQLYAAADVVVAPSLTTPYWEEQFGMVLGEALACGRPLITTASGAIPEVVGDAACVVEPYDVPALTRALAELLGDAAAQESLGRAGRHRAETLYDVPVVARRLAGVYTEMLLS
jgi:starch synthase